MDHEEIERNHSTHNPDTNFHDEMPPDPGEPSLVEEEDEQPKGLLNVFRAAFRKANHERMQAAGVSKRELGRDKSKSFVLFAVVAVILLIAFLGLFSSRSKTPAERAARPTTPNLGRKVDPNQTDTSKSLAPLLSADTHPGEPTTGGEVTPDDVDRTAHPVQNLPQQRLGSTSTQPAYPAGTTRQDYALKGINFEAGSEQQGTGGTVAPPPAETAIDTKSPDLKKPSLVFVRQSAPESNRESAAMITPQVSILGTLPVGTRLIARLQAPVSSAVTAPVVAVVEYNYERNGEIVVPAGAKVIGRLGQVSPTGYVGIQFERIEMPDGASEKVDASAMDLKFTPLKGIVSGRNNGTKFLVRSLTGIGTFASYLVGPHGTNGINGPISENALLRERLADNVSTAGQDKLNSLATNQSIVVTVPGNTRFFIVLQKGNGDQGTSGPKVNNANAPAGGTRVPSIDELRQLLQLRQEINHVYEQTGEQQAPQQQ